MQNWAVEDVTDNVAYPRAPCYHSVRTTADTNSTNELRAHSVPFGGGIAIQLWPGDVMFSRDTVAQVQREYPCRNVMVCVGERQLNFLYMLSHTEYVRAVFPLFMLCCALSVYQAEYDSAFAPCVLLFSGPFEDSQRQNGVAVGLTYADHRGVACDGHRNADHSWSETGTHLGQRAAPSPEGRLQCLWDAKVCRSWGPGARW